MSVYEFGPYKLDVDRLLLLNEGEPVALGPKVVETLLALVEHPREVLAKAMLLDRIWPEGFVEEANLAQNIYVLRKTFKTHWGIDAIETVPRRGYRFTAPVQRVESAPLADADIVVERPPAPPTSTRTIAWRKLSAALAGVALLAASMILVAGYGLAHKTSNNTQLSESGARLYEIGRYYWNQRTSTGVQKSLDYFAQVVDSDPNSAVGYAALAEANAMMGDYEYGRAKPDVYFDRAKEYAQKAIALDPNSAEAHAVLGLIALEKKHMAIANRELERAIALDPAYGPAREWYGISLLNDGKVRDGFHQLHAAADLDPLSVAATAWLGSAAYFNRRFGDAIAYSRQALELSPQRTEVLSTIGEAYEAQGDYAQAIDYYKKFALAQPHHRAESAALLAHAYAMMHDMVQAREQLAYAREHARDVEPADLALAAAAVGDRSIAFGVLKAVHTRYAWVSMQNDPRFDGLRNEREFQRLAQVAS